MNSLTRLFTATRLSGRSFNASAKSAATTKSASAKRTSLSASYLRKAKINKLISRTYCSPTGFAQPVLTGNELLPKVHHSVRPTGSDGHIRVTPHQLYVDLREGIHAIMVDTRPADEFAIWHILGTINLPIETFTTADIQDSPIDRPVYILTGSNVDRVAASVKVADAFKARGHFTNIVESGLKAFPDAGFMYYMDVDAEEARQKAIAAAAAAAQKK